MLSASGFRAGSALVVRVGLGSISLDCGSSAISRILCSILWKDCRDKPSGIVLMT
jgi:hypothetical protein